MTGEDPEGEALDREIAGDRRELSTRRWRRLLFVPPLLALTVAAWSLGASRLRTVSGARVFFAARPPADAKLSFRVELVHATPGFDETSPAANVAVRVTHGRATDTDEDGVSEIVVDPPLPTAISIEARDGKSFREVAHVATSSLLDPDPKNGALPLRRSGGARTGALVIDAWPERSALAPPFPGAAWVRVRDAAKNAVAGATVTAAGDAGIASDPAPATTDPAGLARVALNLTAPPVLLTIHALHGADEGKWHGLLGVVQGVPLPSGDGRIARDAKQIELLASKSWKSGYVEFFQTGVRLGGARVTFVDGHAFAPIPEGTNGVFDLVTSFGTPSPSADDLLHAGTFPIVIASDGVDAFGAVSTSARFDEKIDKPPSGLATYDSVVAATIAAAAPAIPREKMVADGLGDALRREVERGQTVRRASSVAIIGGGLLEFGLMIALGVVGRRSSLADELRELDDEPQNQPKKSDRTWGLRVLAIVASALGIVALVFAALATMAWGLP